MKAETPSPMLARELVDFLQRLDLATVPAAVSDVAKWCLLDSLGCVLYGSTQEWSHIMRAEMGAEHARGTSTVAGSTELFAAPAAALCNGTAGHGFELDDLLDEPIVHPGAIIISAALATAESVNASGARLLLGIIAGYESMNRIGLAMGVEPAHRGTGLGRALLRELARIAVTNGHPVVEWRVLDWNEPSIRFYEHLGAVKMTDWHTRRLTGAALAALAEGDKRDG